MPRFRRLLRWALVAFIALSLLGAIGLGVLYYVVSAKVPDIESLRNVELQEPLYVYADDGRLIGLFGETRRYPVAIDAVPQQVRQAFIAAEDSNFLKHKGVDPKGISRALWQTATLKEGRVAGGSTITQQVARQFFLSSEYSYTRKLAEILLARKNLNPDGSPVEAANAGGGILDTIGGWLGGGAPQQRFCLGVLGSVAGRGPGIQRNGGCLGGTGQRVQGGGGVAHADSSVASRANRGRGSFTSP